VLKYRRILEQLVDRCVDRVIVSNSRSTLSESCEYGISAGQVTESNRGAGCGADMGRAMAVVGAADDF
jgi:hypothetical protein